MGYVDRTEEARAAFQEEMRPAAESMAAQTAAEIVGVMLGDDPEGKRYWDPTIRRVYQASERGEPPAERTGNYIDDYGHTDAIVTEDAVKAAVKNERTVGRQIPLWALLEFPMARPHVRPGAEIAAESIRRATREAS